MKKLNYFFVLLFLFSLCLNKSFGQCAPPTAQVDLDISNVRARILNGGDMWWATNSSPAQYEVPKGSGKTSLFAGALWIGGVDAGGNIRVAAQTYRQFGYDFWPGPLNILTTSVDTTTCKKYDRFWKINRQDVINFIGGNAATADMISYPGNGDPAYNQDHFLAPFYDKNSDGIYNTNDGDYPYFDFLGTYSGCADCNTLHGDQDIWWVINDVGNAHSASQSPNPIGLEIQCQAFAFSTNDSDINNATFYQYKMINRNTSVQLDQTFFGMWIDPDLGNGGDDFIGCDVGRGMGYVYNSDNDDGGATGYGISPPAQGVDILQGPRADVGDGIDNDRDSCIDCTFIRNSNGVIIDTIPDTVLPEYIKMSKFIYYNNNSGPMGYPNNYDYYNYLRATWRDGIRLSYGGDGKNWWQPGATTDTCDFSFPGNSDPNNWGTYGQPEVVWDQFTAGSTSGDTRFLISTGPFTLKPGAVHCISVAAVYARSWVNNLASISALQLADDKIQRLTDSCFNISSLVGIQSIIKILASVYPNPVTDVLVIKMNQFVKNASIAVYDATGKLVKAQHSSGNEFYISCKDFSSGIYFYKINIKDEESVSGKFLKQ